MKAKISSIWKVWNRYYDLRKKIDFMWKAWNRDYDVLKKKEKKLVQKRMKLRVNVLTVRVERDYAIVSREKVISER